MNKEAPFFTVITVTYNREDLVLKTLDTILSQEYKNYEVIVVDNASTDNTIAKIEPLEKEGRIKIIRCNENLERARARNLGFKAAKGDFLTLIDSDDFMYKNNLSDAANFILKNPKTNFFHNYVELVDSEFNHLNKFYYPSKGNQISRLAKGNFLSCCGVFLSKEVYSKYLFNEDDKILGSEDWELWVRVRADYELGIIEQVNNGMLHHQGRSVLAYDIKSILERKVYMIKNMLAIPSVKLAFGKFEKEMYSSAYLFTAISANQAGLFKEARAYLLGAFKVNAKEIFNPFYLRALQIAIFKINRLK